MEGSPKKEVSFTIYLWMCFKKQNKKRKSPIKDWRKSKRKRKKFPIKDQKKAKEKYTERSLDQTMSEWCIELSQARKKRKETMIWNTWSSPSWLPTKSLCLHLFCAALNKKNRKGKGRNAQSKTSHKTRHSRKVLLIHDCTCYLWFDRKCPILFPWHTYNNDGLEIYAKLIMHAPMWILMHPCNTKA